MADAKKCDRCGKYYTDSEKQYTFDGFRVGCIKLMSVDGFCIGYYDLCDNCVKKLMRYLNHEEI